MNHWKLDDRQFHDWAVRKLADDIIREQLEIFCEKAPSEELKHLYKVLSENIIPILHSEGIPIKEDEVFKLFRSWFIDRLVASDDLKHEELSDGDAPVPVIHSMSIHKEMMRGF